MISASGSSSDRRRDFAERWMPISPRSGPRLAPRSPIEWQAPHPPLPLNSASPAAARPADFGASICATRGRSSKSAKPALNVPVRIGRDKLLLDTRLLIETEGDDQVSGCNGHHLFSIGKIADRRGEDWPIGGESPEPFPGGGVQGEDHAFERSAEYQVPA